MTGQERLNGFDCFSSIQQGKFPIQPNPKGIVLRMRIHAETHALEF